MKCHQCNNPNMSSGLYAHANNCTVLCLCSLPTLKNLVESFVKFYYLFMPVTSCSGTKARHKYTYSELTKHNHSDIRVLHINVSNHSGNGNFTHTDIL